MKTNALYYGDNLVWLKNHDHFPDESVDLIYLDPPFNSNADYNLIFKKKGGEQSQAKLLAFEDTWGWDKEASALALEELNAHCPEIAQLITIIGARDDKISTSMAAYLGMMATRLLELHRVLKPTGSIYLHCDPTASHYLKLLMDTIFGAQNYRDEIIWKRSSAHSDAQVGSKHLGRIHDVILIYSKTDSFTWNIQYTNNTTPLQNIWTDIKPTHLKGAERIGYPTQKPQELLERIIKVSSKESDIVLDPFCGCGTAIIAANKLKRKWIGIDITHLAMYMVEQRLKDSFGLSIKKSYQVYGNPQDLASAQALWNTNKKEFEIWALSLVGAKPRPYDGGVDGIMGFMETNNKPQKIVVQVKGGTSLVPGMISDLIGTVDKEKAAMGLLISLHQPSLGMITDSVHAGSYQSELWNKEFLKIQIRTVFELLEGKTFDIPQTYSLLKKAARVKEQGETTPLL